MRTKKITLFLLLLTLFFLSLISNAQDKNDPVFVLDIRLKSGEKKLHDYTIYLGSRENAADSVTVGKSKEVYVTLKRDTQYSFTFHKEGFHDKTLVINTALPATVSSDELFILNFCMEMFPETTLQVQTEASTSRAYARYDSTAEDFSLYGNME